MLAILSILFFVVAVFFSTFGLGGGVVYTPIQVWMGIDYHTAATTSLFLIMILSLSSSLVFQRAGRIDWPLAALLESSSVIGGFTGGVLSDAVPGRALMLLLAAVLLSSGWMMAGGSNWKSGYRKGARGPLRWKREIGESTFDVSLPLAIAIALAAGAASGMLGVGGGVIKIPAMVLLLGIPVEIAVGTSALMVGVTSAGGFAGHLTAGHWDWRLCAVLAVVVFAGGQVGSRVSISLDRKRLEKWFGRFLVVLGASMVLRAYL